MSEYFLIEVLRINNMTPEVVTEALYGTSLDITENGTLIIYNDELVEAVWAHGVWRSIKRAGASLFSPEEITQRQAQLVLQEK